MPQQNIRAGRNVPPGPDLSLWNRLLLEEGLVQRDEVCPLLRDVILEEDGLDRADLGADATVDTLVRVDEVLVGFISRMDAIDWTDLDARGVLRANRRLCDDIGHLSFLLPRGGKPMYGLRTALGPLIRNQRSPSA